MTCSRRKLLIVAATKLPLGPLISYRHEQTLGFVLRAHKIIKDQPCYIHNKTGMNQSSSPILFVFGAKEEIPAPEIHQRLQRAYGSVCMGASSVRRWVKHLKMGKRRQFRKQCVSVFGWLARSSTAAEFSNFQNAGRNVYKEVAVMWKNKESYVD